MIRKIDNFKAILLFFEHILIYFFMDSEYVITTVVTMAILNNDVIDWKKILLMVTMSILYKYQQKIIDIIKELFGKKMNTIKIYSHRGDFGENNEVYDAMVFHIEKKLHNNIIMRQAEMEYLEEKFVRKGPSYTKIPLYSIVSSKEIIDDNGLIYQFEQLTKGKEETIEYFVIHILGNDLKYMRQKINEIYKNYNKHKKNLAEKEDENMGLRIHTYNGKNWNKKFPSIFITFDNLFISNSIKKELDKNITKLLFDDDFYQKYSVPQKLSILLYGNPGCGKTSTYLAIANKYKLPIYIVKNEMLNDKNKNIIHDIPNRSIIVFEEIDTYSIKNRTETTDNEKEKDGDKSVNLQNFLELLDGYYTLPNKAIIILTTNYLDKMDPAIIRKGRIDQSIELENPNAESIVNIFQYHYPDINFNKKIFENLCSKLPTCEYTNIILNNLDDSDKAIKELQHLIKN